MAATTHPPRAPSSEPIDRGSPSSPSTAPITLPWSLTICVLYAYASVAVIQNSALTMGLLAAGLLAARFTPWRIPTRSWLPWVLRAMAYILLFYSNQQADQGYARMFTQGTIAMLGAIWGVEAVIQVWRERPAGNPPGAVLLPLSGLVMLAASMTAITVDYRSGIPYNTHIALPVYILLAIVAIRDLQNISGSGTPRPSAAKRMWVPRVALGIAVALMLGIGAGLHELLVVNRQKLNEMDFAMRAPMDTAGLSASPQLTDSFGDEGSPLRVLRISGDLWSDHLRGAAFDWYHGGTWGPPVSTRTFEPAVPIQIGALAHGRKVRVHVLVDGLEELVEPLDAAGVAPVADTEIDRSKTRGTTLQVNNPAPYMYDLIAPPEPARGRTVANPGPTFPGPFDKPPTAQEQQEDLVVPTDIDRRVVAIAASLMQDARRRGGGLRPTPEQKIDTVWQYLDSNHSYSLSFHPGSGDPISSFLLQPHSAAHCEYFASATTILLRLMGVPTRYVVGYYAHETDGPSTTVVRQRDAHAWAESWIDGQGWVVVDTTPGNGLPSRLYKEPSAFKRFGEWFSDRIEDIRDWVQTLSPGAVIGGFAAIIIGLTLLRAAIAHLRRGKRSHAARIVDVDDPELRALRHRFETLLARSGHACPPNVPWHEHLGGLDLRELRAAEEFVDRYNRIRFGSDDAAQARNDARAALDLAEKG